MHPLPDEHDDEHETASVPVATTSIDPGPPQTDLPTTPTDHPDRPVNAKPSSTTPNPISSGTQTAAPPTSTGTSAGFDSSSTPTHAPTDSFLPSLFPTFGVSKRTQIWIYGCLGLIVVFCAGLGAYFIIQRRKRLRNSLRDDYEFEILDDNENNGTKGQKRRGGELYDAFAGESDENLFSEDDGSERYQDVPDRANGASSRRGRQDSVDQT